LTTVFIVLISLNVLVYAQQSNTTSGPATSGSATGGTGSGGAPNCYSGATCNFYGGSATSGSATSGSVTTAQPSPPLTPATVTPQTPAHLGGKVGEFIRDIADSTGSSRCSLYNFIEPYGPRKYSVNAIMFSVNSNWLMFMDWTPQTIELPGSGTIRDLSYVCNKLNTGEIKSASMIIWSAMPRPLLIPGR